MNPESGLVVQSLGSAIRHGSDRLGSVPGLMKRVLQEGMWREFVTPMGEVVTYERIEPFVTTPPTKGLGADLKLVQRLLQDDKEALDLWDQALQRPAHRPEKAEETHNNVQGSAPVGNTEARALRKLRSDAPNLHSEVLAGNLSAHAAMVKAGFRKRTLTVPIDPARAAATLKRHFDKDQLIELLEHLSEVDD